MKQHLVKVFFALLLCGISTGLWAQKEQLTDEQLLNGKTLRISTAAMDVRFWINDRQVYLSVPNTTGSKETIGIDVTVDVKTGKKTVLEKAPVRPAEVQKPTVEARADGVYYSIGKKFTKLMETEEKVDNPTLSPDSAYVAYTYKNDLYTIRRSDKKLTRLTFDGSDVILNGYASWAYMEEILGRSSHYCSFWWSPDAKQIAFFRSDDSKTPLMTITEAAGQHGSTQNIRYPKAGDEVTSVKIGFVQPDGGKVVFADFVDNDKHYFGTPVWRPDSKGLWAQWMNHGQDNLKLYEVNPTDGTKKELYSEQQKTWINLNSENRVRFLESGKGFIMESDKSGWNQLYLHDMNGKLLTPITNGAFTVLEVLLVNEKEGFVYFTCFKDNMGCEDFYRASLDGKKLQRLSFGPYHHHISLSPNGKYFVTSYSNISTPTRTALYTTAGKLVADLYDSKDIDFDRYELPKSDFIKVKSKDGKFDLPMTVLLPLNMEKGKKYPLAIGIYGGPNALRVRNTWSSSGFRGGWYSKEGIITVMMDHRGSGHSGKVGADYMHRNLGYWEMEDYKQCVQWLIDNAQADPAKVCISGFSYGGYLSCYALAYAPEVFTHAMAGGSVADWTLYDAPYTERYMDSPQENPEGYKSSSVFTHLPNMKGQLLIYHGEIDENVHVQNTLQLVDQLMDQQKNFDMLIYPSSRHGWFGKKLQYENKRRTEFMYRYIFEKPVPEILKKKNAM